MVTGRDQDLRPCLIIYRFLFTPKTLQCHEITHELYVLFETSLINPRMLTWCHRRHHVSVYVILAFVLANCKK